MLVSFGSPSIPHPRRYHHRDYDRHPETAPEHSKAATAMLLVLLGTLIALLSTAGAQSLNLSAVTTEWQSFLSFTKEYGKIYATVEEALHRFTVFHNNTIVAGHGVNKFSDITDEEFKKVISDGARIIFHRCTLSPFRSTSRR